MRHLSPLSSRHFFVVLLVIMVAPLAHAQTRVGVFTGGDAGEGLDLDGTFLYAVNMRGPAAGAIRDATFTDDSAPGVTWSAPNEILNWTNPNYGATANDDHLEVVMQSIRWANYPNTVNVNLANLVPGARYRLQLLFGEQCCNRGFDISVEGTRIAANFAPFAVQGGTSTSAQNNGAVVTHDFIAGDSTLNIVVGGTDSIYPDDNPILQAVTLEAVQPPIPALSLSMLLTMFLLLAGVGFVTIRNW